MKYVLPVPGGKKEFCSEPCLTSYRKAQKALSIQNSAPNPYSLPLTAANGGGAAGAAAGASDEWKSIDQLGDKSVEVILEDLSTDRDYAIKVS